MFLYWLEALPAFAAIGLVRSMPAPVASALFGKLARWAGPLLPISRRADVNLSKAFPEMDRRSRGTVIRDMWENLGRTIGESGHATAIWGDDIAREVARLEARGENSSVTSVPSVIRTRRVEIHGADNFYRLLTAPGPAIVFAAHMGNWELLPVGAAKLGTFTSVVFRTPNNPFVARLVEKQREGLVALLPKGVQGAIAAARVMDRGGRLGLLVDQKQNRGIPVPFFGRDAMTGTTLAKLARMHAATVFGAYVRRVGRMRFVVTVTPPLEYKITQDEAADVARIMGDINAEIESWVREDPAQWLWLHRRWPKDRR